MHRHLDARYRCIFIDLHGLNLSGVENLLWGIATSIRRGLQRDHQLSVPAPDRNVFSVNPQVAFETTFLDAVWSVLGEDHLVLMIDEVIRLHEEVQAGQLEHQVFEYLRHLMQHFERLNFIFSLGSGVEEMKVDYAFLFGVALYHRISFLEPGAARALITKPVEGCYRVTPDAVDKILQITSGHPYYTQLVCHCLFDRWLRVPKPEMTSADVDAVLAEAIELGSANLTYVWEDSTHEEQAVMAGMATAMPARDRPATADQIRRVWRKAGVWLPPGEAAAAVRSLTAREVAVVGNGTYAFAVDLQRLWLDKHRRLDWVKEELRDAVQEWNRSAKAEFSRAVQLKLLLIYLLPATAYGFPVWLILIWFFVRDRVLRMNVIQSFAIYLMLALPITFNVVAYYQSEVSISVIFWILAGIGYALATLVLLICVIFVLRRKQPRVPWLSKAAQRIAYGKPGMYSSASS
jgi:hypothetical protein